MKAAEVRTTLNQSMRRNAQRLRMPENIYEQHLRNRAEEMYRNKKSDFRDREGLGRDKEIERQGRGRIAFLGRGIKENEDGN